MTKLVPALRADTYGLFAPASSAPADALVAIRRIMLFAFTLVSVTVVLAEAAQVKEPLKALRANLLARVDAILARLLFMPWA
jgi:hypothetical protein